MPILRDAFHQCIKGGKGNIGEVWCRFIVPDIVGLGRVAVGWDEVKAAHE